VPSRRVLVVDDDPDARLMFRLILESGGYMVDEAKDGVAAMILIRDLAPDLVVTDMVMPRMDGPELISRIRADEKIAGVSILAVTGHPEARERAAGADALLGKPFDRAQLLALVDRLTGAG
jgi:CheY-like chemotaxis protein